MQVSLHQSKFPFLLACGFCVILGGVNYTSLPATLRETFFLLWSSCPCEFSAQGIHLQSCSMSVSAWDWLRNSKAMTCVVLSSLLPECLPSWTTVRSAESILARTHSKSQDGGPVGDAGLEVVPSLAIQYCALHAVNSE